MRGWRWWLARTAEGRHRRALAGTGNLVPGPRHLRVPGSLSRDGLLPGSPPRPRSLGPAPVRAMTPPDGPSRSAGAAELRGHQLQRVLGRDPEVRDLVGEAPGGLHRQVLGPVGGAHEATPAAPGLDHAGGLELAVGLGHGPGREAERLGEPATGGEPGCPPAGCRPRGPAGRGA